jgi:hypothetical protein
LGKINDEFVMYIRKYSKDNNLKILKEEDKEKVLEEFVQINTN